MPKEKRNIVLAELARWTGKRVTWDFIKQTSRFIPEIDRFHNLITGIYKPAWSEYALSIVIGMSSPYEHKDEILFLDDGRWLMTYSPRAGGLQLSDNRALVKCMGERWPIAVFKQLTDKNDRRFGSTYRVLGLGLVKRYEANSDVFFVESVDRQAIEEVTNSIADEVARYQVQLYTQVMNIFQPFVKEESVTHTTSIPKRDKVFRDIVVHEYDFTCAVCETKFRLDNLTEVTAAHIIPKHKNGSDDPRNGLALCHTHHWAFDAGIFTLTDNHEVLLSSLVDKADSRNFTLLEMESKSLLLPDNETVHPHPEAIKWHQRNTWRK